MSEDKQAWVEMRDTYWNMRSRCYNPNNNRYPRYGGRGIKVCARWLEEKRRGFANFRKDMGDRPPGMTLDRINGNLDYSPDNCRWATQTQQQNNRCNNHIIEVGGEKLTLSQWCRRIGVRHNTMLMRINKYGWSLEKAVSTPVGKRG